MHLKVRYPLVGTPQATSDPCLPTVPDEIRGAVRQLAEFPHEDASRLMYADALEECGFGVMADFVRGQPPEGPGKVVTPLAPLMVGEWQGRPFGMCCPAGCQNAIVRGGVVVDVTATIASWAKYGPSLVAELPIRRVRLADRRPHTIGRLALPEREESQLAIWGRGNLRGGEPFGVTGLPSFAFGRLRLGKAYSTRGEGRLRHCRSYTTLTWHEPVAPAAGRPPETVAGCFLAVRDRERWWVRAQTARAGDRAEDDASQALVAWARRAARMSELPEEGYLWTVPLEARRADARSAAAGDTTPPTPS